MKLSTIWTEEAKKSLNLIYGNMLHQDKLDAFLKSKVDKAKVDEVNLSLRNVYEGTVQTIKADDIFDIIDSNKLIIGANGGFCQNQMANMSPVSKELIRMKKERKTFKEEGLRATDPEKQKFYDNLQTHVKQNTNAFYGIQLQYGAFLYNPDTASLITLQGQELISEMLWTFERLLEGNSEYFSINEAIMFIKRTLELPFNNSFADYITHIPSDEEIRQHFLSIFSSVPGFKVTLSRQSRSFFVWFKSLNQEQKIRLYYSNNLIGLISKNPKVLNIITSIVMHKEQFFIPLKQTEEEIARKEKPALVINEFHKPNLNLFSSIVEAYVYAPISNYQRVFRYTRRFRKSVVLSDTDSVMIHIGSWSDRIIKWANLGIDDFSDDEHTFKIVNTFAYLITKISQLSAKNLCNRCRIPEDYHNLIEMKNEYLFKRLINYASTKKSYAAHIRMREGREMDDLEWKGTKLVSSGLSPIVQSETHDIIENMILKSPTIDTVAILNRVKLLEDKLKDLLMSGDLSLGSSTRFSGDEYKNIYTNAAGRSCLTWNLLYPDDPINNGEYGYMFELTGISENDCDYISKENPVIAEQMRKVIFHNALHPELATYGIKYISIPKDGEFKSLPKWILPYLNVNSIVNKHLQPIASLLPSIGIYRSRISSTKHTHSPLIRF